MRSAPFSAYTARVTGLVLGSLDMRLSAQLSLVLLLLGSVSSCAEFERRDRADLERFRSSSRTQSAPADQALSVRDDAALPVRPYPDPAAPIASAPVAAAPVAAAPVAAAPVAAAPVAAAPVVARAAPSVLPPTAYKAPAPERDGGFVAASLSRGTGDPLGFFVRPAPGMETGSLGSFFVTVTNDGGVALRGLDLAAEVGPGYEIVQTEGPTRQANYVSGDRVHFLPLELGHGARAEYRIRVRAVAGASGLARLTASLQGGGGSGISMQRTESMRILFVD